MCLNLEFGIVRLQIDSIRNLRIKYRLLEKQKCVFSLIVYVSYRILVWFLHNFTQIMRYTTLDNRY